MGRLISRRSLAVAIIMVLVAPAVASGWCWFWCYVPPAVTDVTFEELDVSRASVKLIEVENRRLNSYQRISLDDTVVMDPATVDGASVLTFPEITLVKDDGDDQTQDPTVTITLDPATLRQSCFCSWFYTTGTANVDADGDGASEVVPVKAHGSVCERQGVYYLRVHVRGYVKQVDGETGVKNITVLCFSIRSEGTDTPVDPPA